MEGEVLIKEWLIKILAEDRHVLNCCNIGSIWFYCNSRYLWYAL
jgi:hypothetical protein